MYLVWHITGICRTPNEILGVVDGPGRKYHRRHWSMLLAVWQYVLWNIYATLSVLQIYEKKLWFSSLPSHINSLSWKTVSDNKLLQKTTTYLQSYLPQLLVCSISPAIHVPHWILLHTFIHWTETFTSTWLYQPHLMRISLYSSACIWHWHYVVIRNRNWVPTEGEVTLLEYPLNLI